MTEKPFTPHTLPVEVVAEMLATDVKEGLTNQQVEAQQKHYGFNELIETPPVPSWRKLLGQFNEVTIWLLIGAAIISAILADWTDAIAILAIVLLNGLLGFFQEQKAARALLVLKKLSAPVAKVIRNGIHQVIPARELVPGDLLELEAGDNIPADARLLQACGFRAQESALTGESEPQDKDPHLLLEEATLLADRGNMVYMGTIVVMGRASAIVAATGMTTELGRIAGMLQQQKKPEPTPLQKRLALLGRTLALVCLTIVGFVFLLELLKGGNLLDTFLLAVSLAVAAIPEGLPAVVTITLALGLLRMVRGNALVRRLPSVETLGSVTVICSDKTGTLTRNEMTVREVYAGLDHYHVTGAGYNPHGEFFKSTCAGLSCDGRKVPAPVINPREEPDLIRALTIAAHCNHSRLIPPRDDRGLWQVLGDPTDGALLVAAFKATIEATSSTHEHRVLFEIPFDSERKAMSVVFQEPDGSVWMYSKGAPEVIVGKCSAELRGGRAEELMDARRKEILQIGSEMAARALRVLAVAHRHFPETEVSYPENDLVFVGLIGMMDPPREEAKEAVRKCYEAGIRPIMITGDHPATALAIAREVGLVKENDRAVTGQELDALASSGRPLADQVDRISVFARVSAENKLQIVRAWKKRGQIVAMTGDGVNDAPAVKAADIGIAMGLSGTDVTKEASAMVLTDDNFASIVNAIEEGRCIFENIQKVLCYLLSCNIGEIFLVLLASLLGWPVPLLPIQLLWINLVTDGLPALALALEPPEPGIMCHSPRNPTEPILSWQKSLSILWQGALVGGCALTAFGIAYLANPAPEDLGRARTTTFCVLVFGELFRSLAARSQTLTLFQLGLFSNPFLLATIALSALLQFSIVIFPPATLVFESVTLSYEWLLVLFLAFIPVTVMEISKRKPWNGGRDRTAAFG